MLAPTASSSPSSPTSWSTVFRPTRSARGRRTAPERPPGWATQVDRHHADQGDDRGDQGLRHRSQQATQRRYYLVDAGRLPLLSRWRGKSCTDRVFRPWQGTPGPGSAGLAADRERGWGGVDQLPPGRWPHVREPDANRLALGQCYKLANSTSSH